ncbi:Csa-Phosducin 3 [Gracilaria domingensis]|nr:Csa-Phosducin 3 [Gracilaria domingensis]
MAHVQNLVEAAVKNVVEGLEERLDSEIDRLNNLDDDDLEVIRRKRLAEMKKEAEEKAVWRRNGHGTVHRITEKEFFSRAKASKRMVCIMFRPGSNKYAEDLLEHTGRIAQRHLETLFTAMDVEKAPFLCDRLNIRVLPSIILVKDSEIDQVLVGLDQMSTTGKFTTAGIEKRLHSFSMLTSTEIADDE